MVSWFISPWEAARFSMEAQRLIALQFFGFAFPKAQPNKQSCEERSSGEENATVPRQAPTIAFAEDVVTPSKGIRPAHRKELSLPVATGKFGKRLSELESEKVRPVRKKMRAARGICSAYQARGQA
jgi:hypothetical protein